MEGKKVITREEVSDIIERYKIEMGVFIIREDGMVDVIGDVKIFDADLQMLPLQFGVVCGDFFCCSNGLTTLENAPYLVGGDFNCYGNKLKTLQYAPAEVGGFFCCHENELVDLKGCPQEIKGNFTCFLNELTTLVNGPSRVGGSYYANNNEVVSLEGSPDYVGGSFHVGANFITNLVGCPKEVGDIFSFDNTVASLYMGDQDCQVNRIEIQRQERIPKSEKILPQIIMDNQKSLPIVFRYMHAIQDIFSSDGSFDEEHFALLILDIEEGFE
jgi:hypothetical protein